MRCRTAYAVSLAFHGVGFFALAAYSPFIQANFAVREGDASSAVSQAARARPASVSLDTSVPDPTVPVIESVTVVEPPVEVPTPPPPTLVAMDEVVVTRPPIEDVVRQRFERAVAVSELPSVEPPRREVPEIPSELDPQPEVPELVRVSEQPAPAPERVETAEAVRRPAAPAPNAAVADTGDADFNAIGANMAQGAKVDHLPRSMPRNREPVYPEELRRQRITGLVYLRVTIAADGTVSEVRVSESSGQRLFDEAAVTAVRMWQFEPARRGAVAVSTSVRLPIRFSLRQ